MTAPAANTTFLVTTDLLVSLYGGDLATALLGELPAKWQSALVPAWPFSAPLLAYRRRCGVVLARNQHQATGRCGHCGMPWGTGNRAPRTVRYQKSTRGFGVGLFVVCLWCWDNTTAAQRFIYAYRTTFYRWPHAGVPVDRCVEEWPAIAAAYDGVADATAPFGFRPPGVAA